MTPRQKLRQTLLKEYMVDMPPAEVQRFYTYLLRHCPLSEGEDFHNLPSHVFHQLYMNYSSYVIDMLYSRCEKNPTQAQIYQAAYC
jgi:hypothetical protein